MALRQKRTDEVVVLDVRGSSDARVPIERTTLIVRAGTSLTRYTGLASPSERVTISLDQHVEGEAYLEVFPTAESGQPPAWRWVRVVPDIQIRLERSTIVRGRVFGPRGEPVAGADVVVRPFVPRLEEAAQQVGVSESTQAPAALEDEASSDRYADAIAAEWGHPMFWKPATSAFARGTSAEDGSFLVGGLEPGVYEVHVLNTPGYVLAQRPVLVRAPGVDCQLAMEGATDLTVTVRDQSGAALEGAAVCFFAAILPSGDISDLETYVEATTSDAGTATLRIPTRCLETGALTIIPPGNRRDLGPKQIRGVLSDTVAVELEAGALAAVAGRVLDETGRPYGLAMVTLVGVVDGVPWDVFLETDDLGRFDLAMARCSPGVKAAVYPGAQEGRGPVVVWSLDPAFVRRFGREIECDRGMTITCPEPQALRLQVAGHELDFAPPSRATVWLSDLSGGPAVGSAFVTSMDLRREVVLRVPPGQYSVYVLGLAGGVAYGDGIQPGGTLTRLPIAPSLKITGVLQVGGGLALREIECSVTLAGGIRLPVLLDRTDGSFEVHDLPSANVRIATSWFEAGALRSRQIEVQPRQFIGLEIRIP